jgi:sensor histidine kinase regulating citrate/malate metabolism
MDVVHTNHAVVDAVINQKYRYAQMKGITVIMMVNDLSDLSIDEEDLVTVLSNILDNAVEACENLLEDKIVKLKITTDNDQLLIAVQNPVTEPILIVNNRIVTSKEDKKEHGIGLLNIYAVVEKYNGTCAIQCKNGWFHLTVLMPF